MTLNTKQLNTVIGPNMQEFFNNVKIIKKPKSKSVVIFQCDEDFFNNYGIYNLASCEKNNLDVHIHFINPKEEFLDRIDKFNTCINFSYSVEEINTNINFYKLKSYYFCSRYFITDHLFNNNLIEDAFITDADIIFNDCISIPKETKLGILYYPHHNNLWKQTGANISYVHKEKHSFLKTVIEIYKQKLDNTDFDIISENMDKFERANLYALDQVCMSLALQQGFIDSKFLNLASLDKFIGKNKNTKIWSLTGGGQKGNPNLKKMLDAILLTKYKYD